MGNYKPSNKSTWLDVKINIMGYFDRRINHADAEFPLTHAEVQSMLMEPDTLEIIDTLKRSHRIKNIPVYDRAYWYINRFSVTEELLATVPRLPVVQVEVKPSIHVPEYNAATYPLSANLSRLTQERVTLLFNWINNSVLERRHRDLASYYITEFLSRTETLWHLMIRWPTLQLGFTNDLKMRSLSKPRFPQQYSWERSSGADCAWYWDNKKYIDFIDTLLLDASMMPAFKHVEKPVHAEIQSWKKLGDERF